MKITRVLLLLAAALLVTAPVYDAAWAAQRGPAGGPPARGEEGRPGWQHPAISPEQQAAYEKVLNDYLKQTRPLRNDMWAKRTELEYLSRSEKAEPKVISRLVGELKDLREKMLALHENAAAKLSKDLNISTEHAYALLGRGCGGAGGCGMGAGFDGPRGAYHGGWHGGGHGGWHRGGGFR